MGRRRCASAFDRVGRCVVSGGFVQVHVGGGECVGVRVCVGVCLGTLAVG